MQYDLRSTYSSFDASQQEKHDSGKMNVVPLLSITVITEKLFHKNFFLEFLLSGGQTVDLRSNLRTHYRKSVKRAIEYAFCVAVALLVSESCADF